MSEMRIERSIKNDGTLAPTAINYLGQIPSHFHFINQHTRRAPLAIYNVSVEQLAADFEKALDEYESTLNFISSHERNMPTGDDFYRGLLDAQKSVILSLQAHIDDCYSILASLVDPAIVPHKANKIRFADKWLEAVNFPTLSSFSVAVAECRGNRLAALVNGLKNRQNRLRGIFFHNSNEVRLGLLS